MFSLTALAAGLAIIGQITPRGESKPISQENKSTEGLAPYFCRLTTEEVTFNDDAPADMRAFADYVDLSDKTSTKRDFITRPLQLLQLASHSVHYSIKGLPTDRAMYFYAVDKDGNKSKEVVIASSIMERIYSAQPSSQR